MLDVTYTFNPEEILQVGVIGNILKKNSHITEALKCYRGLGTPRTLTIWHHIAKLELTYPRLNNSRE